MQNSRSNANFRLIGFSSIHYIKNKQCFQHSVKSGYLQINQSKIRIIKGRCLISGTYTRIEEITVSYEGALSCGMRDILYLNPIRITERRTDLQNSYTTDGYHYPESHISRFIILRSHVSQLIKYEYCKSTLK